MTNKNYRLIAVSAFVIMVVAIVAILIFANSRGALSGTWIMDVDSSYAPRITFRGNNFAATSYHAVILNMGFAMGATPVAPWSRARADEDVMEIKIIEPSNPNWRILSGRTEERDGRTMREWIPGLNVMTAKGTYSISDDRIEFIFACGAILVQNIRTTENTLELDGHRFRRE